MNNQLVNQIKRNANDCRLVKYNQKNFNNNNSTKRILYKNRYCQLVCVYFYIIFVVYWTIFNGKFNWACGISSQLFF